MGRKPKIKFDSPIEKAKALKKIGMIPSYDLRRDLTKSQRSYISRLWNNYHEIATTPDKFFKRSVSNKTLKLARQNAVASYKAKGAKKGAVFVPKDFYRKMSIKNNIITLHSEEKNFDKRRQILLTPTEKFLDRVKYIFDKGLGRNEFVQLRIGSSAYFGQTFDNYGELHRYISAWQPKDSKWQGRRDELINQINIIRYTDLETTRYYPEDFDEYGELLDDIDI